MHTVQRVDPGAVDAPTRSMPEKTRPGCTLRLHPNTIGNAMIG